MLKPFLVILVRPPFLSLLVFVFAGLGTLHATMDVTGVFTSTTPGSPSTSESYTFENAQNAVTSFSTDTDTYGVTGQADNVFVRRNGINNDQSSAWYTSSGVGTNLSGTHADNYTQLLTSNSIFGGSDNTFANGTMNLTGNIERLDFTWNSGLTVNSSLAFAVFDRGDAGVHDSFAIAAVTAVDASGNPTAYGSILRVAAGWGGATNAIAGFDYRLFRYANGDNLTASTDNTEVAFQGIGGIVITMADLGLTNGTTIYGYSLMAQDVTAANSDDLLDWTNGTFYPTTTDGNTGGGGLDLAGLNGIAFTIIPEATPTAGFLLAFVALVSACHFLRIRRQVKR